MRTILILLFGRRLAIVWCWWVNEPCILVLLVVGMMMLVLVLLLIEATFGMPKHSYSNHRGMDESKQGRDLKVVVVINFVVVVVGHR